MKNWRIGLGLNMLKITFLVAGLTIAGVTGCAGADLMEHKLSGLNATEIFGDNSLAQLARAACVGDAAKVERLVKSGAPVNGQGFDDMSPLIWALTCENAKGVEALLEAGADPHQRSHSGITALATATSAYAPEFLDLMLKYGGNPNLRDDRGNPILFRAFHRGHDNNEWHSYYALIEHGADINAPTQSPSGLGLAEIAVAFNTPSKAIELIEKGYGYELDTLAFSVYRSNMDPKYHEYRNLGVLARMLKVRGVDIDKAKQRVNEQDKRVGKIMHDFAFEKLD